MKKIYIAGPFRGPDAWAIARNVRNAENLIPIIGQAGGIPVCPHTMYANMQGALPDEFWLQATLELLEVCDAIYLCEGWQQSAGSRGEAARACEMAMPMFETLNDLLEWLCLQGGSDASG